MKAVMVEGFTRFDGARVIETDDVRAEAGQVVVSLIASDVNFPDILYIEGKYQAPPPLPFSPGLAGAGVVTEVGDGVGLQLRLGDRVLVIPDHGTYAEKVKAPAAHCFPIPDDMPFDIAAAFGLTYQTAGFALTQSA